MHPVVVHGGGPQIGELMDRLGKEPEFLDGLRVTDAETLDIARMVLVGKVNREHRVGASTCTARSRSGCRGEDAGLIEAEQRDPGARLRRRRQRRQPVDRSSACSPRSSSRWSPRSASDADGQAYNINADTVAGAIAEALDAEKLVYLTDVAGSARRRGRPRRRSSAPSTAAELDALIADGTTRRRDDPQGRGVRRRGRGRRAARAHPRRPACPTRCCSSSSPTRASAP